jgi:hypothetical protein
MMTFWWLFFWRRIKKKIRTSNWKIALVLRLGRERRKRGSKLLKMAKRCFFSFFFFLILFLFIYFKEKYTNIQTNKKLKKKKKTLGAPTRRS